MNYKQIFNNLLLDNPNCRGQLPGCSRNRSLTPSHLIKVSIRGDLRHVKDNITVHCLSCHTVWEHQTKEVFIMKDFNENMARIKEMDDLYYYRLTERQKLLK